MLNGTTICIWIWETISKLSQYLTLLRTEKDWTETWVCSQKDWRLKKTENQGTVAALLMAHISLHKLAGCRSMFVACHFLLSSIHPAQWPQKQTAGTGEELIRKWRSHKISFGHHFIFHHFSLWRRMVGTSGWRTRKRGRQRPSPMLWISLGTRGQESLRNEVR